MATNSNINCQYSTRYCWEADKVKSLIRLRAELSPLFTGKRNASKYAWAVVERELNVPLPLSKIIKKWNNLLQEYKAIKISEEPKRREWPFFTLMDVYFSDQVNDPSLRLFSSTKTLTESIDDSVFEDDPIISSAIAAATSGAYMDIEELVRRQKEQKHQIERKPLQDALSEDVKHINPNDNSDKPINVPDHLLNMQQYDSLRNKQSSESVQSPKTKVPSFDHNNNVTKSHCQKENFSEQNTIDQYLLSWNNFHGNMCRGFHSLQKDEKMVDVTIAAGGKIFKAHKLVLSVCSSYFQQIFLENPSSHPILLMADVDSSHMAGLLDFMYSGQVNVKYDDLPVFLKVAEAMKIKGLHTEKHNDMEGEARDSLAVRESQEMEFQKYPTSASINATKIPENQSPKHNFSPIYSMPPSSPSISFRDHLQATKDFNDNMNKNLMNINSNNIEPTSEDIALIQKINNSNKILDGRKHSKYFSKRKMLMQYNEHVLMKEKKSKPVNCPYSLMNAPNHIAPGNHPPNSRNPYASPMEGNHEALNLVQNCDSSTATAQDELNKKAAFMTNDAAKRIIMETLQSRSKTPQNDNQYDKNNMYTDIARPIFKQEMDTQDDCTASDSINDDNNNCQQNRNQNLNLNMNGSNKFSEDSTNQTKHYKTISNVDIIRSHISTDKGLDICDKNNNNNNNNNNYHKSPEPINGGAQTHGIPSSATMAATATK